jgi:hypothetical protein
LKRIAGRLPGFEERRPFGDPWFNAGSKSFALFWMPEGQWVFKLPKPQQMMLFDARPEIFSPMRTGRMVWSYVDVEQLDTTELRDLLEAAWREVTPKSLQRKFYSGQPSTRPKQSV